jgi:hypothetical protein
MTIGEQLRSKLISDTTITSVIDERVHQDHMPQANSEYPAIWFSRSSEEYHRSLGGGALRGSQRIATNFDIECMSTSIDTAIDLSERVRRLLDGIRGPFGLTTASTFTVQGVFIEDKSDDYLFRNDASDEGIEVSALGVRIFHND